MRTLLVVTVLLAACSSPQAMQQDPRPPTFFSDDPYDLLGATADIPLRWLVVHSDDTAPYPETLQWIDKELDSIVGSGNHSQAPWPHSPLPPLAEGEAWSVETLDLLRIEVLQDSGLQSGPALVFLFLDGPPDDELGHLAGVAIKNGAFVFRQTLEAIGPADPLRLMPSPAVQVMEHAVAIHEMGHVIGLVDNGIPMLHPRLDGSDAEGCRCHSERSDSVMRAGVGEVDSLLHAYVTDYAPTTFDAYDRQDLAAARQEALSRHPTTPK